MSEYLLLTGAAGLLGRYLLRDLLVGGKSMAVLVRPQGRQSAQARVDQIMVEWEAELGRSLPRPVCLEGDITAVDCGLSAKSQHWVEEHCTALLHNAASLTFDGTDRNRDPWLSNVTGTRNVLELCDNSGLKEMHYVSTAYVCGQATGPVLESELERGQEFRNDYERSKFEAEKMVRAAGFLRQLTVYRPAIIVGDSRTGYTSTYHGLYSYLQFVWMVSQYADLDSDGRWHAPVRLNLTGDELRNLVPVDWVSAVMSRIVLQPRYHGRTYHLTPQQPVKAREVEAATAERFNYYGPAFKGPDALVDGDLNDLETAFYEYVNRYAPYWDREPLFDSSNTIAAAPDLPCPPVDQACLRRLIDFAVADRWGKEGAKRERRPKRGVPV